MKPPDPRFQIDRYRRWMVSEYQPDAGDGCPGTRFRDPTEAEWAAMSTFVGATDAHGNPIHLLPSMDRAAIYALVAPSYCDPEKFATCEDPFCIEARANAEQIIEALRQTPERDLLRRLIAVVDAASMTWTDPVPADSIDAIHDAKEYIASLSVRTPDGAA